MRFSTNTRSYVKLRRQGKAHRYRMISSMARKRTAVSSSCRIVEECLLSAESVSLQGENSTWGWSRDPTSSIERSLGSLVSRGTETISNSPWGYSSLLASILRTEIVTRPTNGRIQGRSWRNVPTEYNCSLDFIQMLKKRWYRARGRKRRHEREMFWRDWWSSLA